MPGSSSPDSSSPGSGSAVSTSGSPRPGRTLLWVVGGSLLLTLGTRAWGRPRPVRQPRTRRGPAVEPHPWSLVPVPGSSASPVATGAPHMPRGFRQTWLLLAAGFGTLVLLIIASGVIAQRKSHVFYTSIAGLDEGYRESRRTLEQVRAGIHISSVVVRDYLLDPSAERAPAYRAELVRQRDETAAHLGRLRQLPGALRPEERATVEALDAQIGAYWDSLDPLFDWTDEEKRVRASAFLRREVMPRRNAALDLARGIGTVHDRTLVEQQAAVLQTERDYARFLTRTTTVSAALGLVVALASVGRVLVLERRSTVQRARAELAEHQLRRLSTDLVHEQEEERRTLSRELHDEVGQMLTGLRMQVKQLRHAAGRRGPFDSRLDELRESLERAVQSVRDIAMGLRPSMLDDLGLRPALEWQARDFARRHDLPVTLDVRTSLDGLPDLYRTAIYRIVQEALTNCVRHAHATAVSITLAEEGDDLRLTIEDNGVGLDASQAQAAGAGLLGMRERARELGGTLDITAADARGTRITVTIPAPSASMADALPA